MIRILDSQREFKKEISFLGVGRGVGWQKTKNIDPVALTLETGNNFFLKSYIYMYYAGQEKLYVTSNFSFLSQYEKCGFNAISTNLFKEKK